MNSFVGTCNLVKAPELRMTKTGKPVATIRGAFNTTRKDMNGEKVEIYTTDGVMTGSATIDNGTATVNTGLEKGSVAIVNIAGKSIKVIVG